MFYCLLSGVRFHRRLPERREARRDAGPVVPDGPERLRRGLRQTGGHFAEWLLRRAGGGADPGPAALAGRSDARRIRAHGPGGGQHALLFPRPRDMRLGPEPLAAQGDGHDVCAHPALYRRPARLRGMAGRRGQARRKWAGRGCWRAPASATTGRSTSLTTCSGAASSGGRWRSFMGWAGFSWCWRA